MRFCLLGYDAVKSTESHPTFRKNTSPFSEICLLLLHAGLLLGLFFDPNDGSDIFLQNVE
jgi:hypothetical protein